MLSTRIITAVVALVLLFVVLFALPSAATEVLIAVVVLAGAWEWSAFLGTASKPVRIAYVVLIAALLALLAVPLAAWEGWVLKLALVWWTLAFLWMFFYPTPIPKPLRWICGALVLVPLYLALVHLNAVHPTMLLFALLIVWAADIGAFFAGKSFGRVRLAPQISPGKTWEGVIGGLLLVAALVLLRSVFFETRLAILIPFCVAVAGVSVIGDLTVSMFKRTAGIKDSGKLFPGHGGILDRIDSVAAAAPLFVLGSSWLGAAG